MLIQAHRHQPHSPPMGAYSGTATSQAGRSPGSRYPTTPLTHYPTTQYSDLSRLTRLTPLDMAGNTFSHAHRLYSMQARASTSVFSTEPARTKPPTLRDKRSAHMTPYHVDVRYLPAEYMASQRGSRRRIETTTRKSEGIGGLGHTNLTNARKVPLRSISNSKAPVRLQQWLRADEEGVDVRQVIHAPECRRMVSAQHLLPQLQCLPIHVLRLFVFLKWLLTFFHIM